MVVMGKTCGMGWQRQKIDTINYTVSLSFLRKHPLIKPILQYNNPIINIGSAIIKRKTWLHSVLDKRIIILNNFIDKNPGRRITGKIPLYIKLP